jgi:hypothetical protein
MMAAVGLASRSLARGTRRKARGGCDRACRRSSTCRDSRAPCSAAAGPWGARHWQPVLKMYILSSPHNPKFLWIDDATDTEQFPQQVVAEVCPREPRLSTFVTLSPVPNFASAGRREMVGQSRPHRAVARAHAAGRGHLFHGRANLGRRSARFGRPLRRRLRPRSSGSVLSP